MWRISCTISIGIRSRDDQSETLTDTLKLNKYTNGFFFFFYITEGFPGGLKIRIRCSPLGPSSVVLIRSLESWLERFKPVAYLWRGGGVKCSSPPYQINIVVDYRKFKVEGTKWKISFELRPSGSKNREGRKKTNLNYPIFLIMFDVTWTYSYNFFLLSRSTSYYKG